MNEFAKPYSLDDLVSIANRLLPQYLPEEMGDSRMRGAVNPRLVRHLTTLGVLEEAGRAGREARYTRRHLLQLLVARRLMAEGHNTASVKKLTVAADDAALLDLLERGAQLAVEAPIVAARASESVEPEAVMFSALESEETNPAVDFLQKIRGQRHKAAASPASASAPLPLSAPAPVAARRRIVPPDEAEEAPAQHWQRSEVVPGLEIHLRDDFVLPPTPHQRDQLLERIWQQIKHNQNRLVYRRKK